MLNLGHKSGHAKSQAGSAGMNDEGDDSFPTFVYAASSDTRTAGSWEGASFINGNQSAELAMISGVGSSGALDGNSYWTWKYDNPATYNSTSIARKWGSTSGSAAGTAGGTVYYYFDAAANWSATEKAAFVAGLTLWSRAVQRCWVGGIESALPHIRGEVRWLIQEGFANRRMSDLCGGNWVGGCHGCVFAFVGRAGGRS